MNVELTTFLQNIDLPKLIELFQSNEITQMDMLPDLTDLDLEKLGLKMGERIKLKKGLQSRTKTQDTIVLVPQNDPLQDFSSEVEVLTKIFFGDKFNYLDSTTEKSNGILHQFQNYLSKTSTEDEWGSLILSQMVEKEIETQINFKDMLIGFLEALPDHKSLFFISNFYKDGKPLPFICPSFKGKDVCMIKNMYYPFSNERKPIVLSLKTDSVKGASSLLNEVFNTNFKESPFSKEVHFIILLISHLILDLLTKDTTSLMFIKVSMHWMEEWEHF
jgi:hypothetical protein